MALEKKKKLRRIEITFTDDCVHPECHCVYEIAIEEDGQEIAKRIHREVHKATDIIENLPLKKLYVSKDLIDVQR